MQEKNTIVCVCVLEKLHMFYICALTEKEKHTYRVRQSGKYAMLT